jgi:hypothetical protein
MQLRVMVRRLRAPTNHLGEGAYPVCESAERNTRAVFAIEQMMGAWVIDIATIKSILTGTDCHHEGEQGVQPNISTATT